MVDLKEEAKNLINQYKNDIEDVLQDEGQLSYEVLPDSLKQGLQDSVTDYGVDLGGKLIVNVDEELQAEYGSNYQSFSIDEYSDQDYEYDFNVKNDPVLFSKIVGLEELADSKEDLKDEYSTNLMVFPNLSPEDCEGYLRTMEKVNQKKKEVGEIKSDWMEDQNEDLFKEIYSKVIPVREELQELRSTRNGMVDDYSGLVTGCEKQEGLMDLLPGVSTTDEIEEAKEEFMENEDEYRATLSFDSSIDEDKVYDRMSKLVILGEDMEKQDEEIEQKEEEYEDKINEVKNETGTDFDEDLVLKVSEVYNKKEEADELEEELDDLYDAMREKVDENRKELVKKGWKAYKDNDQILGSFDGVLDLSVGGLTALLNSEEDPSEAWQVYQDFNEDKPLPEITASMVGAGRVDLDVFSNHIGGIDSEGWKMRDENDLRQAYEVLDALENGSDGNPKWMYYAGAAAFGASLITFLGGLPALTDDDKDIELVDGYNPTLVEHNDADLNVDAIVDGNVTGTIVDNDQGNMSLQIVDAFSGTFLHNPQTGEIFVNESGAIHYGTGDVNYTGDGEGNVTIDESSGEIQIENGTLEGTWQKADTDTLESRIEEGQVNGKVDGEVTEETSLIPWLLTASALGLGVGYGAKKVNEKFEKIREDATIQNRIEAANLAASKSQFTGAFGERYTGASDELNEEISFKEIGEAYDRLEDAVRDLKEREN